MVASVRLACLLLSVVLAGGPAAGSLLGAVGPVPDLAPVDSLLGSATLASDPALPGPHAVGSTDSSFGSIFVNDDSLLVVTYPADLHGNVHFPADGAGPYPLLLLLHGRHGTCAVLGVEAFGTHYCPNALVVEPIDSFRGYDYLAENLASHGYVVVSADANQINDHDLLGDSGAQARGQLVLATLDEFQRINDSGDSDATLDTLQGRIDLGHIGLMGHSRGGEGVARANTLNAEGATPFAISAIFALAPTDFGRWPVQGDVAFATLLPYCDGDVFDLEGSWMYDDARYLADTGPKHQVLAMGAVHNFYNTVWTFDDDDGSTDAWCGASVAGNGRDSPEDQRRHGLDLMASFFRLYVGGETAFAPLWDGSEGMPDSGCPGGVGPCDDRFHLSTHPAAGDGLVIEDAATAATASNDLGGANTFTGFTSVASCLAEACPASPTYGAARQLALGWTGSASWTADLAGARDLSALTEVAFRIGVDMGDARNAGAQDLHIVLQDGNGATASVLASASSGALYEPPGGAEAKVVLNQVRVPLSGFVGVDLTQVTSVTLDFDVTASGAVQVADLLVA